MKQILVTGAHGQLGSEFQSLAARFTDYHFQFTDIDTLDLSRPQNLEKFLKNRQFDIILNCAAYTAVDKAEDDRDLASALNADVPAVLADYCETNDALLIHFSTDYVFDGRDYRPYREDDRPNPVSFYGKTKLDGENAILFSLRRSVIIRTSWLYSSYGNNFVKTILRLGQEKQEIRVVSDQLGSPTCAADLAGAVIHLLPVFLSFQDHQIYHYSNEGVCSWYDFAMAVAEAASLPVSILPVSSGEFPTRATRPFYSVLDKSRIKALGIAIPYWRHSLLKTLDLILRKDS
ncbi:MAG TPA: dTDP-4-dehydrorhamnose reductase [Bacteroidales bacterium]|nr:dTDP-4-dehydrorhamnose reductase [Bacteroidales bacterium]HSA42630.1 dTDP-4-dehydrorhamnose reductase [Bacteroidales bacterium]